MLRNTRYFASSKATVYKAAVLLLLAHASEALSVSSIIPVGVSEEDHAQVSRTTSSKPRGYIVTLRRAPLASYTGGVDGMVATAAAAGQKLDATSAAAVAYAQYLDAQSVAVAARAGVQANIIYKYRHVAAGFATRHLTRQQLKNLRNDPDVALVSENRMLKVHTLSTPKFLGLTSGKPNGAGGAWGRFGGVRKAGNDVIIGVLDTGLWPEHAEFSDRRGFNPKAARVYPPGPTGYTGTCQGGKNFTANTCNRKVVGCQYFYKGWAESENRPPAEPLSCRDVHGHGTHTAATSAGNFGVLGSLSGMAPRARIVVYKVLWEGTGADMDIIAAIDHAAQHGIDIINYSVGGPSSQFPEPMSLAFMRAAQAGILVSASASNEGPEPYTIMNTEPWLMTVAASTHDREALGTVTLGGNDGDAMDGAAWWWNLNLTGGASVSGKLVLGNEAARSGANATAARLCFADTLDPAKLKGKIVVCDRGENARVAKSAEVEKAGGIGMILLNVEEVEIAADYHRVPTIHLPREYRGTVRSYAGNADATAKLLAKPISFNALAPQMAGFSSRGPCPVTKGLALKPDITAPGVDILAAVSPAAGQGYLHDVYSGTSMSAPHMAGLAALMRQYYPTWSPMAIKSALMTTAYQATRTGTPGQPFGTPVDYGAGHVDPQKMLHPGLVFDSSFEDWAYYTCGAVTPKSLLSQLPDDIATYCQLCDSTPDKCDPANLNMPSVSIPDMLPGTETTVYRTVKNVLDGQATFTAESLVESPGKLEIVSVSPSSFALPSGSSQKVAITLKATAAAVDEKENAGFVFGSVTWRSDKNTVTRIPIAVSAISMRAPSEVSPSRQIVGANITYAYKLTPGFSGLLQLPHQGLEPALVRDGSVSTNETAAWHVTLDKQYTLARFSLFNADLKPQAPANTSHDLDLYVAYDGKTIGSSTGKASNETITLLKPSRGRYTVYVSGYSVQSSRVQFYLHVWALDTAQSNMDVKAVPASVETGKDADIKLSFSGVQFPEKPSGWPQERYLGKVDYRPAGGEVQGYTIISVNE